MPSWVPRTTDIPGHLTEEARRRYATMALGGWRFERHVLVSSGALVPRYRVLNPQGTTVVRRYTLMTAVDVAWYEYGGNGKA